MVATATAASAATGKVFGLKGGKSGVTDIEIFLGQDDRCDPGSDRGR